MKVRVDQGGTLPTRAHRGDAGWDLYAPEDFVVPAGGFSDRVNLLVGFEIPAGHVGFVMERSSQGKNGIFSAGPVVDHGYTGNVHITLGNMGEDHFHYSKGDRVGQLVVFPIADIEALEVVDQFEATERGEGAHGSTGQ